EPGAFLLDVRRGQVDGDLRERDFVAAVSQRRADPLPALANRRVGQADSLEVIVCAPRGADVDLYFYDVGIYSVNGCALRLEEHPCGLSPCGESILARLARDCRYPRKTTFRHPRKDLHSAGYRSTVSIESGTPLKVPSDSHSPVSL